MINRLLYAAMISVALLMMASCGSNNKYKSEVDRLDSLLSVLDSAEKDYRSLDTVLCREVLKDVNEMLAEASTLIKDTMKKDEAILLSNYRSVLKPLREFISRRSSTLREAEVTRKQLNDMSHDMKAGLMSDEDVKQHFSREEQLAVMLVSSMKLTADAVRKQTYLYDSLKPEVATFVEGMRAKGARK